MKEARYALAVALLDAGRPQEAIPHLIKSTKDSPCDAAIWANLVRAQFESGDNHGALHTIAYIVHAMPTNVQLMVTLALLCSTHRETQKARHLLENASELEPDDPEVKALLAQVSLQGGEPVEALAVLKEVPANYGKAGQVAFMRGMSLALVGKVEESKAEFGSEVTSAPQNVRYRVARAWAYQWEDQQQEALKVLDKARALDPRSAMVPYRMGVSYFLLGQYRQAMELCEQAISLAPRYAPAHLVLGVSTLEQGDLAASQKALRQAISINPKAGLYHRELAVTLFKAGDLGGSKKELDESLSLDPKAAQAYFWRARLLSSQGQKREAIADLETAIALEPHLAQAYDELAKLYSAFGERDKAAEVLAKQKQVSATSSPTDRERFLWDLTDPLL
jgi:tetratricopeptide (TPR) repeat protein